ncbi:MAG: FAD-dependent oxidoreductase [Flavisolibacter sp.]
MKRDGAKESIWQNSTAEYTSVDAIVDAQIFDVLIVGGGITGITTAMRLQREGLKCVIAESYNLCFGTTGGTTAHINTFFDESYDKIKNNFGEDDAQLLGQAAKEALNLFKKNIETFKLSCDFSVKQGYLFSQNAEQTQALESVLHASQKAGIDATYSDGIPVPIDFQKAIVFEGQAQINPAQYVMELAKEFENSGGVILQNCQVINYKSGNVLEIKTGRGTLKSKYLIYATHIPQGINLLHFRCAPYRSYAIAVTLEEGQYPENLVYDMQNPYHYIRTYQNQETKFLIVGGEDHKTGHEENTQMCFTRLEAYIRKYFAVKNIVSQWSSQYFESSDGLAYIGVLPGSAENVFVATGYGGNGMTYSHIAAILLTDLIIKGESPYAELFDPNRIKMVAGFSRFVKENADVIKQFVGKRLAEEKMNALADLAPGEAKVVSYEGESIALYKGENGSLHAVNPVCTHAKCKVSWNGAEKSWDCPCHGARYSPDGDVLTGPSTSGLEKINLRLLTEKR